MQLKSLLAGTAIACATFCVQAADIERAFVLDLTTGTTTFGDAFAAADSGKSFLDKFAFSIASGADVGSGLVSFATLPVFDLAIGSFDLYKDALLVATGTPLVTGIVDSWVVGKNGLTTGDYTLRVAGLVNGPSGGSFGGNVNVTPEVSPVPEPGTWAMMLGGLAALGFNRRKSNTVC